jgi:hypothetical protein
MPGRESTKSDGKTDFLRRSGTRIWKFRCEAIHHPPKPILQGEKGVGCRSLIDGGQRRFRCKTPRDRNAGSARRCRQPPKARVVGKQPRALPWRIMKTCYYSEQRFVNHHRPALSIPGQLHSDSNSSLFWDRDRARSHDMLSPSSRGSFRRALVSLALANQAIIKTRSYSRSELHDRKRPPANPIRDGFSVPV